VVEHLYAHHNADGRAATFLASSNVAFPRRELLVIGGFDARYPRPAGEDRDLCDRWQRLGRRMVFAPEAVVRHAHVLDMGTFWRQHFDCGRGAFAFRRARSARAPGSHSSDRASTRTCCAHRLRRTVVRVASVSRCCWSSRRSRTRRATPGSGCSWRCAVNEQRVHTFSTACAQPARSCAVVSASAVRACFRCGIVARAGASCSRGAHAGRAPAKSSREASRVWTFDRVTAMIARCKPC